MARGINKVILIGNLGKDPEVRHTANGDPVATVSLATSDSWRDKQTGEQQDRTEWHRVVFFKRLAEIVNEYLRKGSTIYVEGSLRTNKWQDQSGNDRYTTEIIATAMTMLGERGKSDRDSYEPKSSPPPKEPPQQPEAKTEHLPPAAEDSDFDDDIPF